MKRLNKMIVCLGGVLVFSMGLNFSVQTIYAQENVAIVDEGENGDIAVSYTHLTLPTTSRV